MSRYDDNDRDDVADAIEEFLKSHSVSELLGIVTDMVQWKELYSDN